VETNNQKGLDFEKKCLEKLEEIGFSELSYTSNTDNGADILGKYKGLKFVFQCKAHQKKQGNKCVQEVVAARRLYGANRCVVISNSDFTPSAIELANANMCILITSSEFFALNDFPPDNYLCFLQQDISVHDIDYNVLERYEKVRRAHRRTPKWDELDKHLQYRIKKEYKNYGCFLKVVGDPKYSAKPSNEEIRKEYLRIKSIIGRVPTLKDIEEHSSLSRNSFSSYPFTKLQNEVGDRPNIERGVTKRQLTEEYFLLQEKIGHPPTVKEIDELCKYRSSYYRKRWGSMDAFLDSIGKTRTEAGFSRVYTKEEIVCIYSLIKLLLSVVKESNDYKINHTVLEHLDFYEKNIISPSTISKKFGSWDTFVQYLYDTGIESSLNKMIEKIRDNNFEAFILEIIKMNS